MNPALNDLKDIHLPDPVSWWPMAPGWWLLITLLLLILTVGFYYWRLWHHSLRYKKSAIKILTTAFQSNSDDLNFLNDCATITRRLTLSIQSKKATPINYAGLQGKEWQQVLQQHMPEPQAELLTTGRYQAYPSIDRTSLYNSVKQWLKEFTP